MASGFRPEFEEALHLLASAFEKLRLKNAVMPVVVGGAAVEFYTGGAVVTGDFDLVAPDQEAIEIALVEVGFRREDRPQHLARGFYHPQSNVGIEVVGSRLFDGAADPSRSLDVDIVDFHVRIASIEDMIADRLGQHVSAPNGVPEMLQQATLLWRFTQKEGLDEDYLDRRIKHETSGLWSLADLKSQA